MLEFELGKQTTAQRPHGINRLAPAPDSNPHETQKALNLDAQNVAHRNPFSTSDRSQQKPGGLVVHATISCARAHSAKKIGIRPALFAGLIIATLLFAFDQHG